MRLSPGDRIDRYEVIELLGRGGMGEVYRARDPKLARLVALKILHLDLTAGTDGPARLLREARAAAALSHANVLSIFDVGEVQEPARLRGVAYIAMELVVGRSLGTYVGDETVPLERRIGWLRDVATALGVAHAVGIVHRDVKPENVMIRADGAVKVLDFGIARQSTAQIDAWSSVDGHSMPTAPTGPGPSSAAQTLTGTVAGTPLFMAPEQLRGEIVDGRADQFAWGVMAYALLVGRLPWSGRALAEPFALVSQILSLDPERPSEIDPRIPRWVSDVVTRALSKRKEDRFETMEALVGAIDAKGEGATMRSGGGVTPLSHTPRMDALALAQTAPQQIADTKRGTSRRGRWGFVALGTVGAIALAGMGFAMRRARPEVVAVVEPPSQMSSNAAANDAYRAGLQAYRDASLSTAESLLQRAVELDPVFALAHLRLVLTKVMDSWSITAADLQPVRSSRASLNKRDQALLDALEPRVFEHPDLQESARRFAAVAARWPSDSDARFQHGVALDAIGQRARALQEVDAAFALDPQLAVALMEKADLLFEGGDLGGGSAALAQCVKISPGTTSCVSEIAALQSHEGQCEALITTGRRCATVAPTLIAGYERLAEGLFGAGEPVSVVRDALKQRYDRETPEYRRGSELDAEAALAILSGDFDAADRLYKELQQISGRDEDTMFAACYPSMLLALETGRNARATELADAFLQRRSAWSRTWDHSLFAYDVKRAAGSITAANFTQIRDRWLAQNQDETAVSLWLNAHAKPVATESDARSALATKPEGLVLNPLDASSELDEEMGRTYVLAGQPEEGIRLLKRASSSCEVLLGTPAVYSTWATQELGEALEARGQAAEACVAYGRVLARWGRATRRSRTAEKAAERRAALGCKP